MGTPAHKQWKDRNPSRKRARVQEQFMNGGKT